MKKDEFILAVHELVQEYIDDTMNRFDRNTQLRVNPAQLTVSLIPSREMMAEIDDNDAAIEAAAAAQGAEWMDDSDYQARELPDFYPVTTLIDAADNVPSEDAIARVAATYFS